MSPENRSSRSSNSLPKNLSSNLPNSLPKSPKKPFERRESNLTRSSEVLQGLFENGKSGLSDQYLVWKIWSRWASLVGPTLAEVTMPLSLRKGHLKIWVKSSVWMNHILFSREQIKITINQRMAENIVTSLYFTLDRAEVPSADQNPDLKGIIENL